MDIDFEEKPRGEYWGDFVQRFVAEAYREVRDGRECYIYSKANLEQVEELLKIKNVKYIAKEKQGYWIIKPDGEKNGRKKKK